MNISTEHQTTTHIGTMHYQINTPPFEILMDHMISQTPTFVWIQRQASENACTPGEQYIVRWSRENCKSISQYTSKTE